MTQESDNQSNREDSRRFAVSRVLSLSFYANERENPRMSANQLHPFESTTQTEDS
jgi:hypothetical protein